MEKTYKIDISKNKNGTSYSVTCSPLRIASTVHHHDLQSYIEELVRHLKIRLRNYEYKLIFSRYIDAWGIKRNQVSYTNK